jgi:cytochrome c
LTVVKRRARRVAGAPAASFSMGPHGPRGRENEQGASVNKGLLAGLAGAALGLFLHGSAGAADAEAAQALMKQNNCSKCHSVDKDKDGPSFRRTARGFAGRPNAEQKLVFHLTSGEIATFPDGHEEAHKIVKTTPPQDMNQILNLVHWILEQK